MEPTNLGAPTRPEAPHKPALPGTPPGASEPAPRPTARELQGTLGSDRLQRGNAPAGDPMARALASAPVAGRPAPQQGLQAQATEPPKEEEPTKPAEPTEPQDPQEPAAPDDEDGAKKAGQAQETGAADPIPEPDEQAYKDAVKTIRGKLGGGAGPHHSQAALKDPELMKREKAMTVAFARQLELSPDLPETNRVDRVQFGPEGGEHGAAIKGSTLHLDATKATSNAAMENIVTGAQAGLHAPRAFDTVMKLVGQLNQDAEALREQIEKGTANAQDLKEKAEPLKQKIREAHAKLKQIREQRRARKAQQEAARKAARTAATKKPPAKPTDPPKPPPPAPKPPPAPPRQPPPPPKPPAKKAVIPPPLARR